MKRIFLQIFLAVSLSSYAQKKAGCYVPTIFDRHVGYTTIDNPKLATMRKALLLVDQMVKDNPYFKTLPEMRFRNQYDMNTQFIPGIKEPPLTGRINCIAYGKNVWVGECELYSTADVIGARYSLSVSFNDRYELVGTTGVDDEDLKAFTEPQQTGTIAGYPYFNNSYVILQKQGKLPWVKVTVEEYLDFKVRDWKRRKAEFEKQKLNAPKLKVTDADIKRDYEAFKKINPQKAEEYLNMMDKMKADEAKNIEQWMKQNKQVDQVFIKQKEELDAYRAQLSKEQLQQQAFLGANKVGLSDGSSMGRPLAKMNPDFGWVSGDPNRIQLITVSIGKSQPEELKKALESLDYKKLASLLQ